MAWLEKVELHRESSGSKQICFKLQNSEPPHGQKMPWAFPSLKGDMFKTYHEIS